MKNETFKPIQIIDNRIIEFLQDETIVSIIKQKLQFLELEQPFRIIVGNDVKLLNQRTGVIFSFGCLNDVYKFIFNHATTKNYFAFGSAHDKGKKTAMAFYCSIKI